MLSIALWRKEVFMTAVNNTSSTIQTQSATSSSNASSTENQSTRPDVDSIKDKIKKIKDNAEAKRTKQLEKGSQTSNNDSNTKALANCPNSQGATNNQQSLTIQTHKDIEDAKKILKDIRESTSLTRTEKADLTKQLRGAFETMDSFFQLEQQLLQSSVQRAESQARADRGFADGMSARERRKDKGAANEQARSSEIRSGNLKADLVLAQSNKMQVTGVLQSINSTLMSYETDRIFNRG